MSQQEEFDRMLGAAAPPAKDRLPDRHVRIVALTPFGEEAERRETCLRMATDLAVAQGIRGNWDGERVHLLPVNALPVIDAAKAFYDYLYAHSNSGLKSED